MKKINENKMGKLGRFLGRVFEKIEEISDQ